MKISITIILFILILNPILSEETKRTCIEGDCQNGKGKLQNEEGIITEGNFKNGKPHGLMKGYKADNPEKFSAMHFLNGKIDTSKSGTDWYYEVGMHYEGFFNDDGDPHGKGKLTYLDGSVQCVYEGSFQNGKKHGPGKIKCEDGTTESGEWKNDRKYFTVELDFVCRSVERVDKWEGGTVSGKLKFRIMRNAHELQTKLSRWDGIQVGDDWNGYTIAEAEYNDKNVIATFLLFIPSEMDKDFDKLVARTRDIQVRGRAIGVAHAEKRYPVVFVDKVQ
ncbi:MORN repeat protein [Leptospira weilii str. 2006001853]|uniref:MORN repeat protein n=1 Tax=Leptospira weilii str. 2006001853 TaxID=1001589 RepID=A0A828Z977_9LEPT|nr:MORN repeat protein [Leptospira weilii]EKR62474.1 MORN repeat protein [Leptospira weilii str. 2006001853]EKR64639.1 MORN repeat protein [Leptospira weilii str. 2006001853]EKR66156.1 MORN repeat protein [Leptospira weilii str. 2006001853]